MPRLVFVLAIALFIGIVSCDRLQLLYPYCPQGELFAAGINRCQACHNSSTPTLGTCQCDAGFAPSVDPTNGAASCVDCSPNATGVSLHGRGCIPCGSVNDALAATACSTSRFRASTYSAALRQCTCPAGHILTESAGGAFFDSQVCAQCTSGVVDPNDATKCISCVHPFVVDTDAKACKCATGYTQIRDTCVLAARSTAVLSVIPTGAKRTIEIKNENNEGRNGGAVSSQIISSYIDSAISDCENGNQTGCNLLANMCVLAQYDLDSAPCGAYRSLQARERDVCRGYACEIPSTLPWLYYIRGSPLILQDESIKIRVSLSSRMKFVLSTFSWNGTWLGYKRVTTQLQTCDFSSSMSQDFYAVGSVRMLSCFVNLRWFLAAPETVFYELYLDDNGVLRDIPVLLDYSNKDIDPTNVHDRDVFRAGSTDSLPSAGSYVRRFYMYDNVGGIPEDTPVAGGSPAYITVARRVKLLVSLSDNSRIFTPLLIVQYASFKAGDIRQQSSFVFDELKYLRTNSSEGKHTLNTATSIVFTMDTAQLDRSLMIVLIVFCVVCLLTAWGRTTGWMRRQQNLIVGMGAMVRFFIYYCQHLANIFFLVILVTCWYMYLFYKYQSSVEYALPATNTYIWGMLYTAVSCKGLVVIYRIYEQCNADIFVIDWERSKGALLRQNKEVPVSMWRSTFIANEFNELQTLREWNPLFVMVLIMFFLEGLGYVHLAASVPWATTSLEGSAPPHPFLRIAVASFFWIAVKTVISFLQWYIYYKVREVHPLQAFVDLCSVSNISIMVLLEPQWGFYIHGESIHAHADISVEEFQDNLKREAQENLPKRGLGGQESCQTFEVFIGTGLRAELNVRYTLLYDEYLKTLNGKAGSRDFGHHRRCFEFITGGPGQSSVFTEETLEHKRAINAAFQRSVRGAEKENIYAKVGVHKLLDFPPTVSNMNGTFGGFDQVGGVAMQSRDLFFLDDPLGYGRSLLFALDFDLFLLYLMLYLAIDTSLYNSYVAMTITYALDILIVWYRAKEGQANIGSKTLFDDRFFL